MARKLSPGIHNIRIKKPGGGTRMQRVKVLKSGKFKFIKNVKGGAKPKKAPSKKAAKPGGKAKRTSPGRRKTMARRKSSLPNRIANGLLLLLAFSRPLKLLFDSFSNFGTVTQGTLDVIVNEASFGLSKGGFNATAGATFYAPVAAAFILFEVKKMAMKKFRF